MESGLCCVCGAHSMLKQRRIVLEQSTNIISYVCERIAPQIISENDYICQLCYKNIEQTSKESKPIEAKETNVGLDMEVFEEHTEQSFNGKCSKTAAGNECLMCNTILFKTLYILKHDPTKLHQIMLNLITEAIPPEIKISSEDKVCSKCWCKVRRCAMNLQEMDKLELEESRSEDLSMEIKSEAGSDQEHSELIKIRSEDIGSQIDEINDNSNPKPVSGKVQIENYYEYLSDLDPHIHELKDDPKDPDFIVDIIREKKNSAKQNKRKNNLDGTDLNSLIRVNEILLPSYKRASNACGHCVFPKCKNQELKNISKEIRTKLIQDYKFYIPPLARMCTEHLSSNSWNTVEETDWPNLKFNANHIEHMFSMVQEKKGIDIDFSDVLKLDDSLIKYVLGTTRDILSTILTREPKILSMNHGVKGLLGLFIKHENGSSNFRISNLLNMPRKVLCSAMRRVQKILSKSPVINELGLQHMLLELKIK